MSCSRFKNESDTEFLLRLAELYSSTRYGKFAQNPDLAFRNCAVYAFSFARFLILNGYPRWQVSVAEYRGAPDFKNIHPDWETRREKHSRFSVPKRNGFEQVNHYMTQIATNDPHFGRVDIWLVDWSYRQFDATSKIPDCQPVECCRWKKRINVYESSELTNFKQTTGKLRRKTNAADAARASKGLEI